MDTSVYPKNTYISNIYVAKVDNSYLVHYTTRPKDMYAYTKDIYIYPKYIYEAPFFSGGPNC